MRKTSHPKKENGKKKTKAVYKNVVCKLGRNQRETGMLEGERNKIDHIKGVRGVGIKIAATK